MGRIEIITRTERRRRYSEADRGAILAEADAPGATVREVCRRHGIAESLVYHWRRVRRKAASIASEPLQFISYGELTDATATAPTPRSRLPAVATPGGQHARQPQPLPEELVRPHPGLRPGAIDIALASGVRLSVDMRRSGLPTRKSRAEQRSTVLRRTMSASDVFHRKWADRCRPSSSRRWELNESLVLGTVKPARMTAYGSSSTTPRYAPPTQGHLRRQRRGSERYSRSWRDRGEFERRAGYRSPCR